MDKENKKVKSLLFLLGFLMVSLLMVYSFGLFRRQYFQEKAFPDEGVTVTPACPVGTCCGCHLKYSEGCSCDVEVLGCGTLCSSPTPCPIGTCCGCHLKYSEGCSCDVEVLGCGTLCPPVPATNTPVPGCSTRTCYRCSTSGWCESYSHTGTYPNCDCPAPNNCNACQTATPTPLPTPTSCPLTSCTYTESRSTAIANYCGTCPACPAGCASSISCTGCNPGSGCTWCSYGVSCTAPSCNCACAPTPTPTSSRVCCCCSESGCRWVDYCLYSSGCWEGSASDCASTPTNTPVPPTNTPVPAKTNTPRPTSKRQPTTAPGEVYSNTIVIKIIGQLSCGEVRPTGQASLYLKAGFEGFIGSPPSMLVVLKAKDTSFAKEIILPESGKSEEVILGGLTVGQTYDFLLSSWGFLVAKKNLTISSGRNPSSGFLDFGILITGDLNGDNQINGLDWSWMKLNYGESGEN